MHADASVRGGATDRPLLAGAVDADAVAERDEPRPQRVVWIAGREGLALERVRPWTVRRGPRPVLLLVEDAPQAGRRLEPGTADRDRVGADQSQGAEHAQRVRR